jgi:Skp family chaperone for outer membrane proteins
MIARRTLVAFTLAALAGLVAPAPFAAAQSGPSIATINPAKIFNEMQETKDLKQKMASDAKAITDEGQRRGAEVEDAKKRRGLFNDGTEDAEKANKEYMEKAISFQAWQQMIKAQVERDNKRQMKTLFEKIEQATKQVAQAKKIDLVLVEQRVEMPADLDQINVEQLRALINQRSVLYSSGKFDVSNDVLAALDAQYKQKK